MPRLGKRYEAGGLCFDYNCQSSYEVFFQDSCDVMSLTLSPARQDVAYDTDRVTPLVVEPYGLSLHPAGSATYALNENQNKRFIAMRLDPAIRKALQDELGVAEGDLRTITNIVTPQTRTIAEAMRRFMLDGTPGGRLAAESFATLAMLEAVKALGGAHKRRAPCGKLPPERITKVVDYIEAQLDADLSLNELADIAAMSVYHFARRFKETMGLSPHAYVTHCRVQRAREMLAHTHAPLTEVAQACGFANQSHFTTVFRNRTGLTPGQLRKGTHS